MKLRLARDLRGSRRPLGGDYGRRLLLQPGGGGGDDDDGDDDDDDDDDDGRRRNGRPYQSVSVYRSAVSNQGRSQFGEEANKRNGCEMR